MPRIVQWEQQIGRRLRLRDLFVFFMVVKSGSMAKAAAQLGVSGPSISEIIADLEHALGVRLLDRSHQGVLPTRYGQALLRHGEIAFDELRQGVKEIEYLSDPTTGELKIGCPETIATTVLPQFVQRFAEKYPRVVLQVDHVPSPAIKDPGLRDRKYDLIFAWAHPAADYLTDDLNIEPLFDEQVVVVAGMDSAWKARRNVDLAELADASWILSGPNTWHYACVANAFHARGLGKPRVTLVTFSVPLITHLLANGPYVAAFARSVARLTSVKILPIKFPAQPFPFAIVTLKNRSLSPVAERFIECAREVAKTIGGKSNDHTRRRQKY
jgi:DNA-binding transcriptional LysR family regulator